MPHHGVLLNVRVVDLQDKAEWLRMRTALWPHSEANHSTEIERFLIRVDHATIAFVAERKSGMLGGFLEAGTRPWSGGCSSSPVGYIEGWWVDADLRRSGVGAMLIAAAETWARSLGLTEMASDAELTNEQSHAAHQALGYEEVERIVCFRKQLRGSA
jgi:aminoglycoside 6'-N-acetyltransferase I